MVILFDGVCNLCNGFVQFVIRHDAANQFTFATLQSETGQRLLGHHGLAPAALSTIVLVDDELQAWTKSDAVMRIGWELGFPWKLLSLGVVLPRALRDACYTLVANNRYRLLGQATECWLMTPELARKFMK
ncbi:thiol-disulfide oxidoreductase DCC family protein [Hymenobacter chitinivorans]|uniref:Putative DCC family thiol-disulfide oxidoreductase YuxK n=1 Tax=Hymenobacter chitinivorans DSM 11115 TaxID=1121954 RepID=A0A2M9BNY0_9BACT|nr:thiol-disulfide oxidoreductase DCC family protein [Hymenobacter chitinivorans]PJJ59638.1 putative DCC family thiol-disulfide oxidoreductase YuxK [Hymenobacter chitinivorans DSM 11115]